MVPDHELTVNPLQDIHPQAGIAEPVRFGQQLQDSPPVFDRVVPGHLADVLEADGLGKRELGGHLAVGFLGLLRGDGEPGVEAGQELPQRCVGLLNGAGSIKSQLRYQPVLEG